MKSVNESPVISHTTPVHRQDVWSLRAFNLKVGGIYLMEVYLELLVATHRAVGTLMIGR